MAQGLPSDSISSRSAQNPHLKLLPQHFSAEQPLSSSASVQLKNHHLVPRRKLYRAGRHSRALSVLGVKAENRRREQADASAPRAPGRRWRAKQESSHSLPQLGSPRTAAGGPV